MHKLICTHQKSSRIAHESEPQKPSFIQLGFSHSSRQVPGVDSNFSIDALVPFLEELNTKCASPSRRNTVEMMLYPISKFVRDSVDLIVGYIDASGAVKVEPRFVCGGHFCEGKAFVVDHSRKSGLLDLNGKLAVPPSFRGVSEFHEGVCTIGADAGVGYIDHSGKWIIPPRFLIAMPFSEGRAFVSDDGETFRMIDTKGSSIGRDSFELARVLRAGLAPAMKNGRWGFIDGQGNTAIPFDFDDTQAQHFKSGLAAVKVAGNWGFIDRSGSFAIKPYFEDVRPFAEGLAPVKLNGKWGMIDLGGGVRLSPKWDELGQLVNGLAVAGLNGKFGYIDPVGQWAIDPVYGQAKSFFGELALVQVENVPAYIRFDGQLIWEFEPQAIIPRPPIPL